MYIDKCKQHTAVRYMIKVDKEQKIAEENNYTIINSNDFSDYGYVIRMDGTQFAWHKGWTFQYDRALVLEHTEAVQALRVYKEIMNLPVEIVLVLPEDM